MNGKKVMAGLLAVVGLSVLYVFAESEPINPSRITTPQINAYGVGISPIQINGTNVTATAAEINVLADGTGALTGATVRASGAISGGSTLGIAGVATFNTNAAVLGVFSNRAAAVFVSGVSCYTNLTVKGDVYLTVSKAAGALTNAPIITMPADTSTNTMYWIKGMLGTNHVVIPCWQCGP